MPSTCPECGAALASTLLDAREEKRARGEYLGGSIPYGYRLAADGVHLEDHPVEQDVIGAVLVLSGSGLSTRRIASMLEAHTIDGARPLCHIGVWRVLRRARGEA